MDRRASLRQLLGHSTSATTESKQQQIVHTKFTSPTPPAGLTPYTGPWEFDQAAHLLRRATFGPNRDLIRSAVDLGLEATLDSIFAERPLPDPPVNPDFEDDPNVPIGQTWVDTHLPETNTGDAQNARRRSIRSWTILQMMENTMSIREKMTLFWVNHFGIGTVNEPRIYYMYTKTLRTDGLGDFKQLIKDITVETAMLIFLNGNQNNKNAPNENYARELLELFTVGKGAAAGPGDYTTFTEQDVAAMARSLTGWRTYGGASKDPENPPRSAFQANRHDTGAKQLSHRFGNAIITDGGENEYSNLIDLIFEQPRVATFICRKLYQWFVYYKIDETVEAEVIAPMAQLLIDNDYNIAPALRTLLSSEHFFNILSVGPMIKNPLDYCLSMVKQLDMVLPEDLATQYDIARRLYFLSASMELDYIAVPSVAGWKAYYQTPQFYRFWINASTLQLRSGLANQVSLTRIRINGYDYTYHPLAFIEKFENPTDPNMVVEEFSKLLHPQPLTDVQKTALKDILIPGLPDFEWTLEYGDYTADPENEEIAKGVDAKLRKLTQAIISLAEFHLS